MNGYKGTLYDASEQPLWFQVRWDLFTDRRLQLTDVIIYSVLMDYYTTLRKSALHAGRDPDEMVLFPSRKWIGERCEGRVSPKTVTRAIQNLISAGWLQVQRTKSGTNRYFLVEPPRDILSRGRDKLTL